MIRASWSPSEILRLRARAQQLAAPPAKDGQAKHSQPSLVVGVGGELCAIPTAVIHGVARLKQLAPLPRTGPDVVGLFAWAGEILPAFQLRTALALPLSALPEGASVVVVGRQVPEAGLVVDSLEGARTFDLDALAPVPERMSARARRLVRGLAPLGIPVLDGDALLDSDALFVATPGTSA